MQAGNTLVSLNICADSPEPSLLENVISTKIQLAGSISFPFYYLQYHIIEPKYAILHSSHKISILSHDCFQVLTPCFLYLIVMGQALSPIYLYKEDFA